MKTAARTDVAKFFCGFETMHALSAGYFWLSGLSVTFLGFTVTPMMEMVGAFVHTAIAIVLALYAWGGKPAVGRSTRAPSTPPRMTTG